MRGQGCSLLRVMTWSVAMLAAGASVGRAQALDDAPVAVVVADSLYAALDVPGAMAVLSARVAAAPDDFEATWRAAGVALTLAILTEDRGAKLERLRAAAAYGERLLALRPEDPASLTWAAASKGRLAMDVRNPVTAARLAQETWALTATLLAQDPSHPMGNAVRGKLVQEVRRLSWGERVLARVLVGGDLAGAAEWSDAERYLERSVVEDPGMVLYHLDLGDTYRLQGKKEQALEVYERGLGLRERLPVDAYYKRRIGDGIRALAR